MSQAMQSAASAGTGELRQGVSTNKAQELSCDVVVVGSGAGGGATSYELARAGLNVIVLEEGGYVPTEQFTSNAAQMLKALYRDAGSTLVYGKPDVMFTEGRVVGGSTVVNAGICWRTSERILKRWVWEHGLPSSIYSAEALDPVFQHVETMVNAAPQNPGTLGEDSHRIKLGCDRLGYEVMPVQRSQRDCMGSNNCIFGCPTGAKQSTLVSYLPRAVQLGARLYSDTRVERITTDRTGKATGVVAHITNPATGQKHRLVVHAKAVVSCCGAVQTPLLLRNSGLGNKWVGNNLMLHPNTKAVAVYDDDIYGWKGAVQGFQVDEFIDEGILMATTFIPPSLLALTMPSFGDELGEFMADLNRMVVAGVLVEDSTTGTVRRGMGGQAVMRYQCTSRDISQMIRGVALLSEIYFAGGASKVYLPIEGLPVITSPDEIRKLYDYPLNPTELEVLTVHAMGTACLSSDPSRGATNPQGQLWGHPGVYVADASLFPTSIGVNPQETIMALATCVAQGIADSLRPATSN